VCQLTVDYTVLFQLGKGPSGLDELALILGNGVAEVAAVAHAQPKAIRTYKRFLPLAIFETGLTVYPSANLLGPFVTVLQERIIVLVFHAVKVRLIHHKEVPVRV
jgi:hypothetical protein